MVDMTTNVPVVMLVITYIMDLVSLYVKLVTLPNPENVTKSVTLVILTVPLVMEVMLTIVKLAHKEDSYIWDSVLKSAQPKCSLTPLTESVNGVTNIVLNVPDNTKVNVPNVMPQDINTTTTVSKNAHKVTSMLMNQTENALLVTPPVNLVPVP